MTELPPGSGVDYREPACTPAATPIDQNQPQLATAPVAAGAAASVKPPPTAPSSSLPSNFPLAPAPAPLLPPPATPATSSPQMGDMILRGMQSPFAGLAKLLGNYNLFG